MPSLALSERSVALRTSSKSSSNDLVVDDQVAALLCSSKASSLTFPPPAASHSPSARPLVAQSHTEILREQDTPIFWIPGETWVCYVKSLGHKWNSEIFPVEAKHGPSILALNEVEFDGIFF